MPKRYEDLDTMARAIREIGQANGWELVNEEHWESTRKIPTVLALIHSEVSEALEAFRRENGGEFLEELADVVIRVLDCAGGFTDDFTEIVCQKIAKNATRGYRHGGRKV